MRIKTRACRAGISKIPPKPSSMAARVLSHVPGCSEVHPATSVHDTTVNEAEGVSTHGVVPETSSSSDDRKRDCLSPSSSGKMAVLAKKRRNSAPDVSLEKHLLQKKTCIKCDKGGQVLVCSESGCPLAIHEKCMGCLAVFDDMGCFYCPYCSYKRAAVESDKAREKVMLAKKALSKFIDRKIDGNLQKQKAMRSKKKEPHSSTSARDRNYKDTENKLNSGEAPNQSLQAEEDLQGGASAPDCTRCFVSIKGAEASFGNEQNDVLFGRCGENAKVANCNQPTTVPKTVVEQEICLKISGLDGSDNCRQEETTPANVSFQASISKGENTENSEGHQFVADDVGEILQVEHSGQVDDHHREEVVEDQLQAEENVDPARKSSSELKTTAEENAGDRNKKVITSNKSSQLHKPSNQFASPKISGLDGSDNCRQEETTPANVSFQASIAKGENTENSEAHQFVADDVGEILQVEHSGQVDDHHRKEVVEDQLQAEENVDPARKSSSELKTNAEENAGDRNKKVITSNKSSHLHKPSNQFASSTSLNARRKKLPWTTEEEEMLKEGVHKFSTTVKKNLPWRKILEFGSHIFHQTRTPVDLKDKWRNILGKEPYAISRRS